MEATNMKIVFTALSAVSALGGLVQLYFCIVQLPTLPSLAWFFSGLISLLSSYAWGMIGDMWQKQQELGRRIPETTS